jgi:hypothetical protein
MNPATNKNCHLRRLTLQQCIHPTKPSGFSLTSLAIEEDQQGKQNPFLLSLATADA